MKKLLSLIAALALCLSAAAQSSVATINSYGQTIPLQAYSPSTIRVIKHPTGSSFLNESFAVIAQPSKCKYIIKESSKELIYSTDLIKAVVNKSKGTMTFYDKKGRVMLAENAAAEI